MSRIILLGAESELCEIIPDPTLTMLLSSYSESDREKELEQVSAFVSFSMEIIK
jgi:hypothetical protein